VLERLRRFQGDEDKAFPALDADSPETERLERRHPLSEVRGAHERSIETVGPAVVLTLHSLAVAGRAVHHPGGTMAADVDERVDAMLGIADDDERDRRERQRDEVTRGPD